MSPYQAGAVEQMAEFANTARDLKVMIEAVCQKIYRDKEKTDENLQDAVCVLAAELDEIFEDFV